jgi:hypothetical protein
MDASCGTLAQPAKYKAGTMTMLVPAIFILLLVMVVIARMVFVSACVLLRGCSAVDPKSRDKLL